MGAWGVEPYENDDGSDIKEIWDDYLNDRAIEWGAEKVLGFFKRVYFRGSLPVVSDGNSSLIIAIAQKFEDNELALPNDLETSLKNVLTLELSPQYLSEWGHSKKKRKKFLISLAEKYEFELECSDTINTNGYLEEIESLKKWFSHLEEINGVRQSMSLKTINFIDSIKPEFGKYLEKATWDFYDEQDEDGSAELGNLRFMYVVWFALFNTKVESEDIIKAVENERL